MVSEQAVQPGSVVPVGIYAGYRVYMLRLAIRRRSELSCEATANKVQKGVSGQDGARTLLPSMGHEQAATGQL